MYLKEYLSKFDEIKLYVDMDGVIVDYDVGNPSRYDLKRPLITSINKLEEISKSSNIELYILSVTKHDVGIKEKNDWLDKYAPFFKKENRIIISKENKTESAAELKSEYIKTIDRKNKTVVLIDDDPRVLKTVSKECTNIVLLKDTALVD